MNASGQPAPAGVLSSTMIIVCGVLAVAVGLTASAGFGWILLGVGALLICAGVMLRLVLRSLHRARTRALRDLAAPPYTCPECGQLLHGVRTVYCPECGTVRPRPLEGDDAAARSAPAPPVRIPP